MLMNFTLMCGFPAITSCFFVHLPKSDHRQSLSEYRPISLIGSIYKIISKVLAMSLKRVLGLFMSPFRTTCLPNRQILDVVLVVNELVD